MYKLQREFIYGWDDTEFDDNEEVITYDTPEEAQASLDDHIKDVNDAYAKGDMDSPYEDDMKVVEIDEEITCRNGVPINECTCCTNI